MRCHICDCVFDDIGKYIFHAEYIHKLNVFTCPIKECLRSFQRKDSFKKHMLTHRPTTQVSQKDSIIFNKKKINKFNKMSNEIVQNKEELNEETTETQHNLNSEALALFCNQFQIAAEALIANLYNNLSVTKSAIQNIISLLEYFFSDSLIKPLQKLVSTCDNNNILEGLKCIQETFHNFGTEYKRMKHFENAKTYIKPLQFTVGTVQDESRKNNQVSLCLKNRTCSYVPITEQLKCFLELPNVLAKIKKYQESNTKRSEQDELKNICQGQLWKNIKLDAVKTTLPLLIYFDDFEVGNPLGTHAGCYKVGAVYYTIPTIPPEFISRLENIFVACLFHSSDRTEFGNRTVLRTLINELISLEKNGIYIKNENQTIYFATVLVLGDNLGVHSILGLTESFSSNYCCRFCIAEKKYIKKMCSEDKNLIRKKSEYPNHVQNDLYGIKEECVFNDLTCFHVYENLSVDPMHDILEGVLRYDMAVIVSALLNEKYFNVETLNFKIKYNVYDSFEKNIPPSLKLHQLKNKCLTLSASEMSAFVRNFRFMVGNLIPKNNKVWEIYLLILKITEICSSISISDDMIVELENLITQHHALYLNILKEDLKPKHHFLLHYPRIMKLVGPLHYISSMRFEGKHKDLKTYAHNIRSRVNIPFSLADRMQMKCNLRYMSRVGLDDIYNYGHSVIIPDDQFNEVTGINRDDFTGKTFCEKNGITYKPTSILRIDQGNKIPQFGKIKYVLANKNDERIIAFLCEKLITEKYNSHYHSFEIAHEKEKKTLCFYLHNLKYLFPTCIHLVEKLSFVALPKGVCFSTKA